MKQLTRAALLALSAAPLTALSLEAETMRSITISAEGQVEAQPDMATATLGVSNTAATAAEAMNANTDALRKVIELLTGAGIEARDIQTTGLSLGPVMDYNVTPNVVTGYQASNMVTVRVRDLTTLGALLDKSIGSGANTLNGLTFGVAEPGPLMDEARKEAVVEARRRAELYAAAAGVKLGPIVSISETSNQVYGGPMFAAKASVGGDVPIQSGEVGISASVTVTYELAE